MTLSMWEDDDDDGSGEVCPTILLTGTRIARTINPKPPTPKIIRPGVPVLILKFTPSGDVLNSISEESLLPGFEFASGRPIDR